eukprot:scaffold14187_cov50-Phaeocystis_antarctica.AAC.1
MGVRPPSQPDIEPESAATRRDPFGCCFALFSLEVRLPVPARAASVARREVKEEDGVPSRPKQMVVKFGSGSSGYTFERKGA